MRNVVIFLFCVILSVGCGNESAETEEKCRFGTPVAVFSEEMKAVESANFRLDGRTSIENVLFKNRIKMELVQSGCNAPKQEFSFTLPKVQPEDDSTFWMLQAEGLLRFLANSDPRLVQFGEWANMIQQKAAAMKLGDAAEVQPGYFITVDKIESSDETVIRIILAGV